jgi:predicted HTH domain antitoxin
MLITFRNVTLTLDIPDSVVAAMRLPPEELRAELRLDLAVVLYARGALPIGKAMEFAGMSRRDFERLLKERQVRRPFDEAELKRELS